MTVLEPGRKRRRKYDPTTCVTWGIVLLLLVVEIILLVKLLS